MNKVSRDRFIVLTLILFGVLSYKIYEQYIAIEKTQRLIVFNESESIAVFIAAFRKTYQDTFLSNHIEVTQKTIKLLPVQTIAAISEHFSESLHGDIVVRTVSDRPRNPDNMANIFELEKINFFKNNPNKKSEFIKKEEGYFYTQPLYIQESCLKCHGKREDVTPSIRDKYETAYDYKLGELRGLLSIHVKERNLLSGLYDNLKTNTIIAIMIFFILVIFMYLLMKKISDEVEKNKKTQQTLFNQSRMAQMGEMISMIAHQWRQPLGAISSISIDLNMKIELEIFDLETQEGRAEAQKYFTHSLHEIDTLVNTLTTTIDDFRNFYAPTKQSQYVLISDPALKAINIIRTTFESEGIEIIGDYGSSKKIDLYRNEMMQVILNLLKNSQDNFRDQAIENPKIFLTCKDSNNSIIIELSDNGGGIPKDIIDKIFDPYFSTKDERNGTGLGLYMSKIIVEEHHKGSLHVNNTKIGVCFTIKLPLRIDDETS